MAAPTAGTVLQISAGIAHTCALLAPGEVWCWGDNRGGQVGPGQRWDWSPRPWRVEGVSGVVEIAAGSRHTCARGRDSGVVCWGSDRNVTGASGPEPQRVEGLRGVTALAAGANVSCALLDTGRVACWNLARATEAEPRRAEELPDLDGVAQVAVGDDFVCARLRSGEVRCRGENDHGQLGIGDPPSDEDERDPAPLVGVVGLRDAVEIVAGAEHACARRAGGGVVCWGRHAEGQLGIGGEASEDPERPVDFRRAPAVVTGITDAVGLAAGEQHTCARRRGGAIRCWGAHGAAPADGAADTPTLPMEVPGTSDVVEVAAGGVHTCVRRATGEVACWGDNSTGELAVAHGYTGPQATPAELVGLGDVVEVVAGGGVTCARQGAGPVRCWGRNHQGVNGDGTASPRPQPGPAVVDLPDAIGLSALDAHLCAVRRDGTVSCWGRMNLHAEGAANRNRPGRIEGVSGAVEVSVGMTHDCARLASGRVLCWGQNDGGQLGNGGVAPAAGPVMVRGLTDAAQLATANGISCALRANGQVTCWGQQVFGATTGVPAVVPGLGDAVEVRVGEHLGCARRRSGRVLCWYHSRYGHAHDARPGDPRFRREIPGLTDAAELRMGGWGACVRRSTGTVVCWGANGQGQLGTGETGPAQENPVAVVGLTSVLGLAAGEEHACAWTTTGSVACWGAERGQLGSGVILRADAPAPVVGLGVGP